MRRLALFIPMLLAAACGSSTTKTTPATTYHYYIVEHGSAGDPYWDIVHRGSDDAVATLADQGVKVTWLNPDTFSTEKFVSLVQQAIDAEPDGLIVTVPDPNAVDAPLRTAIAAGLPVICIDSSDSRPLAQRIPYLFYIGSDETLGGESAGARFAREGQVHRALCAPHESGNGSLTARCNGLTTALGATGATVDTLEIGGDPTGQAQTQALQTYYAAHPDLDAILTLGPVGAKPTMQFLTNNTLWASIRHGSFDLDPDTNASIENNQTLFTIDAQPYLIGYEAVSLMHLHVLYAFTPGTDFLSGPAIVDKSDIAKVAQLSGERIR
jgi:simple sugar transport system substrate-binding protein